MGKRIFFLGLISGIIAAVAAIMFQKVHQEATYTDFSRVLSLQVLIAINVLICMLASLLFGALARWLGRSGEIIFNVIFLLFSFGSIMYTFGYILPLDMEFPEMFPGLTVPMHFFPAICWFAVKPVFFPTNLSKRV